MNHIFRFRNLAPAQYVKSCDESEDAELAVRRLDHDYPTCRHMIVPDRWLYREADRGE